MKILIACEFSGIVREAFKAKGHDAWSCDLLPTEIPGQHIQGDVLEVLNRDWDMMIAHPPCTRLARNGIRWIKERNLWTEVDAAAEFFKAFLDCNIPKKCIENPVMHKYAVEKIGKKCDQIIQPYQYGHDFSKKTCLWITNLPLLVPTNPVELTYHTTKTGKKYTKGWYEMPRNGKARSRTFKGIAQAMADQWG